MYFDNCFNLKGNLFKKKYCIILYQKPVNFVHLSSAESNLQVLFICTIEIVI